MVDRAALTKDIERAKASMAACGEEYFCSSMPDGGTIIWLMERMKMRLLQISEARDG